MKKFLLSAVAVLGLVFSAAAADESFAVSFMNGAPKDIEHTSVEGMVLGVPFNCCKKVNGAGLSIIGNQNEMASGFAFSLIGYNFARSLEGAQLALVNIQKGQHGQCGVQLGVFNTAAQNGVQFGLINNSNNNAPFQFGLLNINNGGYFPVMILVNFGKEFFD